MEPDIIKNLPPPSDYTPRRNWSGYENYSQPDTSTDRSQNQHRQRVSADYRFPDFTRAPPSHPYSDRYMRYEDPILANFPDVTRPPPNYAPYPWNPVPGQTTTVAPSIIAPQYGETHHDYYYPETQTSLNVPPSMAPPQQQRISYPTQLYRETQNSGYSQEAANSSMQESQESQAGSDPQHGDDDFRKRRRYRPRPKQMASNRELNESPRSFKSRFNDSGKSDYCRSNDSRSYSRHRIDTRRIRSSDHYSSSSSRSRNRNYRSSRTPPRRSTSRSNNSTSTASGGVVGEGGVGGGSSGGISSYSRYKSREPSGGLRFKKHETERDILLAKWRKDYCSTGDEMSQRLQELTIKPFDDDKEIIRSTPAETYYQRQNNNAKVIRAKERLLDLCDQFKEQLVDRAQKVRASQPKYELPPRKTRTRLCKHKSERCSSSDSSSEEVTDEEDCTMEELVRKQQHPERLHLEMWYNDPGEMNDGPLCRCSLKARRSGIRHGIYAGEKSLEKCDIDSNNAERLYHYRITISPPTNFLTKTPTIICHDDHEFIFEGFSMFSHFPLEKLPTCKVIRFNIEYTILYVEEKSSENFCIRELDLFHDYLFREILELVDFNLKAAGDENGCSQFHFMPRFVRDIEDGKEILSMCEVLRYLMKNSNLLIEKDFLPEMVAKTQYDWQNFADEVKGMVVTYPGKKPCSVRVDQLDRNLEEQKENNFVFPEIVHFGIRPPQLSYAGNPEYQRAWRDYVKFRHLLANMPKPSFEDKRKLEAKEVRLQDMRTASKLKRDVTVAVSAEGFHRTGIMCDIVQHAMLIPVLVCHLRFHHSLDILEENIGYKFQNRFLLQLALTHPSYRENFGTNPDHARNSLTNCGIRQPEYGDRRIHYMNTRKRGINTLINIMSRFGKKDETESNISHNERLEFLGDAVVEFLTSIHLFFMFPDLEEGGLATYRAALVQNQHLAVLARTLQLEQYMLYAHGSDLCHDLELRHAMANCFEALMGALFLDGGITVPERVFGATLFKDNLGLLEVWEHLPLHPLQEQEPNGDRHHITNVKVLQKLTDFEQSIGVDFKHIRLLARAFTDRSIGFTNLTLGSNQRLEFLGDTVLQLISSEYLYKHFPEHHEGHLSLLRSSLVNNRTQAVVCDDLNLATYAMYNNPKAELKTKDRADLLEAVLGALYVDKDLEYCTTFCNVTLFPRLQDFIMNQDWNDPKSKLQQCCLTLRTMEGGEPDIPIYKVIECKGPTNTRVYTVAVYFRGQRLAKATGHSIQQAEMNAARQALDKSQDLFPQLDHQKRVIAKSMKKQRNQRHHSGARNSYSPRPSSPTSPKRNRVTSISNLPESYRHRNSPTTISSASSG